MEELRPLLGAVGLVVVAGAVLIAIARARGRRFEWWERFFSPERPRRSNARKSRPASRSAARRTASAESGEPGSRGKGRPSRRPRSRSARASDRQTSLGLEDVPLLDPVEGPHATALDREFDVGDLSALGQEVGEGEGEGEGADPAGAHPAPSESAAETASDEAVPDEAAPDEGASDETADPEGAGASARQRPEQGPAPEPPSAPRKPSRLRRRPPPPPEAPRREDGKASAERGTASGGARAREEMLVVLTIMTPDEQRKLAGDRIRQAFASFDLEPDEDGLFHHFGNRKGSSRQPVFSVASVLEPGVFDVEGMDHGFETPGLCLFMRRPGPFLATVAFDLMLDVASRLARTLEAVLCDQQRCRLTAQATQALRERVVHFALRHERDAPIRK